MDFYIFEIPDFIERIRNEKDLYTFYTLPSAEFLLRENSY
jgi:hypothetical protein